MIFRTHLYSKRTVSSRFVNIGVFVKFISKIKLHRINWEKKYIHFPSPKDSEFVLIFSMNEFEQSFAP